jgi:hypothetical protein
MTFIIVIFLIADADPIPRYLCSRCFWGSELIILPLGNDLVPLSQSQRLHRADGDRAAAQVVAELHYAVHQDEGQVVAQTVLPLLAVQDRPCAPGGTDLHLQAQLQLHLSHRPVNKDALRDLR